MYIYCGTNLILVEMIPACVEKNSMTVYFKLLPRILKKHKFGCYSGYMIKQFYFKQVNLTKVISLLSV